MPSLQSLRQSLRGALARYFEAPVSGILVRVGFTPNRATLAGIVFIAGAAYCAATGRFWLAGALNFGGSAFDLLDGAIARRQGLVSSRGALLDSTVDRVEEAAILIGLAWWYSGVDGYDRTAVVLAFVAFAGSMMVSYIRARAEGLGYSGKSGFLTRPERVVVLTVCLVASPLWTAFPVAALWVLAIGTPLSAFHRFWSEWRAMARPGNKAR